MAKYKICDCIFDLKFISEAFFHERLEKYQYFGLKPAQYLLHSRVTEEILPQAGEIRLQTKTGIRYIIGEDIIEDLYKDGEVITRITYNGNNYYIDIKKGLEEIVEHEYSLTTLLFSEIMRKENKAVIHAAAIAYNNQAILFSAPSGTGKSTQAELWLANIGDSVYINEDKPVLSIKNKTVTVWGNPWSGKTSNSNNISVPLKAIVYLEQSDKNEVLHLDNFDKIKHTMVNLGIAAKEEDNEFIISMCNSLIDQTEMYLFKCNMEKEAPFKLVKTIFA